MAALFEPFVWMLGIVVNIYFTVVLAEVVLHWLVRFGIVDVKTFMSPKSANFWPKRRDRFIKRFRKRFRRFRGSTSPRLSCCWFCCFWDVSSTGST